MSDCRNSRFFKKGALKKSSFFFEFLNYPDFCFLFIRGSQDCPDFSGVEIDRYWDRFSEIDKNWDYNAPF